MKYITFAVPCYNSQDYLSKCVASLIAGGDDVEIIIVDDGSTDNTAAIADDWAERYPSAVKVIHKPNGGHGSGIMAGLGAATGLYYKVVDSDDWLDGEAYASLLSVIKDNCSRGEEVDLYITNFVYEHVNDGTRYISGYAKNFPQNRVFGWDEIKPLKLWKMLLMHSLVYNTQKLRQCGISLPEHTFYEDNLFAYAPLAHMQKLYYLNVDMYRYYIGRSDQTVTIDNLVSHYADQITVMRRMLAAYSGDLSALPEFENVKRLADERTRNAYERLADICRANAVAEEKIAKGMELVDAQAAESALVYAKEMLRSYPAHAKAWGLYIAAKCLADRSYDPTRDIGFMCKCPDYKRVYLEDGFSPRVLAPVAAERYAAIERKRNARSAALKKYVIGPVFAAAAVAMGIAVWKIIEAMGG